MNTGLRLISTFDLTVAEVQKMIWTDLYMFQTFLSKEIAKIAGSRLARVDYKIESYATLPNSDTLSLYEIYQEAMRHYEVMKAFQGKATILNCKSME